MYFGGIRNPLTLSEKPHNCMTSFGRVFLGFKQGEELFERDFFGFTWGGELLGLSF